MNIPSALKNSFYLEVGCLCGDKDIEKRIEKNCEIPFGDQKEQVQAVLVHSEPVATPSSSNSSDEDTNSRTHSRHERIGGEISLDCDGPRGPTFVFSRVAKEPCDSSELLSQSVKEANFFDSKSLYLETQNKDGHFDDCYGLASLLVKVHYHDASAQLIAGPMTVTLPSDSSVNLLKRKFHDVVRLHNGFIEL